MRASCMLSLGGAPAQIARVFFHEQSYAAKSNVYECLVEWRHWKVPHSFRRLLQALSQAENVLQLTNTLAYSAVAANKSFIIFVPESEKVSCKIFLEVRDTDSFEDVIDQQTVPCSAQKFHFQSVSLRPRKFYEICAKFVAENVVAGTASQNFKCIDVESEANSTTSLSSSTASTRKEPILPLVLTLIFLSVGIAVLVVLYLVVKGYLNDRHLAGFLPEPAVAQSRRAYKVIDSLLSSLCSTCNVFSMKHRRRRRRDHIPVDQVTIL